MSLAVVAGLWALGILSGFYANESLYRYPLSVSDMALWDFGMGCLAAAVVGAGILAAARFRPEALVIQVVWLLKVAVTLGLMLVYERAYSFLDAYGYFQGARELVAAGYFGLPNGTGTYFIPELVAGMYQALPVSYHAAKVIFSTLGFIGSWLCYEAMVIVLGRRSNLWCAILMAFPPVLFWGSILGKDSLMLFLLGVFTWLVVQSLYGRWWPVAAMGALVVGYKTGVIRDWAPKIYVLAFLLSLFLWGRWPARISAGVRFVFLIWLGAIVALGPGWWYLPDWLRTQRDSLFYYRRVLTMGGSAEAEPFPLVDWADFILYLPYGAFSALFRPLPMDVMTGFGWITGLLNYVLLLAVGVSIISGKVTRRSLPAVGFLFLTCLVWSVVYGFISPANMGMGARFQLQVLPFLLMLVSVLLDENEWFFRWDSDD